MKNHSYSDKNLEEFIQKYFGVNFEIKEVIVRNSPVSYSTEVTIFKSNKNRIYAFISSEARTTLGDVQGFLSKMNLKPAEFFPPNGYQEYFFEHAKKQFIEVFPGRHDVKDDELRYYKKRVLYNPALAEIAEIKDGEIRGFNTDSIGSWRTIKRYSYKKITMK